MGSFPSTMYKKKPLQINKRKMAPVEKWVKDVNKQFIEEKNTQEKYTFVGVLKFTSNQRKAH